MARSIQALSHSAIHRALNGVCVGERLAHGNYSVPRTLLVGPVRNRGSTGPGADSTGAEPLRRVCRMKSRLHRPGPMNTSPAKRNAFLSECPGEPCPVTMWPADATTITTMIASAAGRNKKPRAISTPPTASDRAAARPHHSAPKPMPKLARISPVPCHRDGPPRSFGRPWNQKKPSPKPSRATRSPRSR